LHAQGLAHRDLKPGNLLVSRATHEVRLIDLGLACWEGECERRWTTGTVWYSSPEQMMSGLEHGTAQPDWDLERFQKADLYALGLILLYVVWRKDPMAPWVTAAQDANRPPFDRLKWGEDDSAVNFATYFDFNSPDDLLASYNEGVMELFRRNYAPQIDQLLQRNPNLRTLTIK
jgi:serine/threonine protein kinase